MFERIGVYDPYPDEEGGAMVWTRAAVVPVPLGEGGGPASAPALSAGVDRRALVGRAALSCGAVLLLAHAPAAAAASVGEADVLTRLARALFPHPGVPDATYARIVAALPSPPDGALAAAAAPYRRAVESARTYDEAAAINAFLSAPAGQGFRAQVLVGLYGDLGVTRTFGYPGPSLAFGGYLDHGLDDATWLPEPTARADG